MPENTANTIIAVRDLTFGYHRRRPPVLDHVSLTVPQGQSIAVLGYNGVGKTTLLHLIMGLLRPWSGDVAINADLVPGMRDVFLLSDRSNLAPSMTVRENIRFRAMLMDADASLAGPALAERPIVRAFGLADQLDKKISELSSGLAKRAGLVAGMLFDPHLILLDEPTNAVDPVTRDLLIALMRQLKADGRTVITVTHDLEYCRDAADRVIVLDHGRVALDAMTADYPDFEAFRAAAMLGREPRDVDFGLTIAK